MDRRHKNILRRHGQRVQVGEAIITIHFPAGRGRRVDLRIDAPLDLRVTPLPDGPTDNQQPQPEECL